MKGEPSQRQSNSTSCSDNALRLLVLVAGRLYEGLQVTSSFSIWGCVLKGCFERGIFWRPNSSRLKGIEDFNLEQQVRPWWLGPIGVINGQIFNIPYEFLKKNSQKCLKWTYKLDFGPWKWGALTDPAHMGFGAPLRLASNMKFIRWEQRRFALRRRSGPPPQPRGCRPRRPPSGKSRELSYPHVSKPDSPTSSRNFTTSLHPSPKHIKHNFSNTKLALLTSSPLLLWAQSYVLIWFYA